MSSRAGDRRSFERHGLVCGFRFEVIGRIQHECSGSSPSPRGAGVAQRSLTLLRWSSAVVFITFGVGKFVNHASETDSFRSYGLPAPGTFTIIIGVVEIGGGILLLVGRTRRAAALVLAGDMVGAIVLSGILRGEDVSLTLAPALLAAMLLVLVADRPTSAGHWELK